MPPPVFFSNINAVYNDLQKEIKLELTGYVLNEMKSLTERIVTNIGFIKWRLTGQWLGSTNISLNIPDFSLPGKLRSYAIPGKNKVRRALSGMKIGDSPIVTLPQPYTRRLEHGWSKKDSPYSILAAFERARMER